MSLSIQISNLLSRLLIFLFFSFYTNAQTIEIPKDIWNYQRCISLAMNQVAKNNLDSANYYIIKASGFKEIHPHHQMYLKYMLKRCFNEQIFFLEVKSEFKQYGYSTTYSDSSYLNSINTLTKKSIKDSLINWQLNYLNNRSAFFENNLWGVLAIDQFARDVSLKALFDCYDDSCYKLRRKLLRLTDSLYSYKFLLDLNKTRAKSYQSFGTSYFNLTLLLRHLPGSDDSSSQVIQNFHNYLLNSFIITPDYYANLRDYLFHIKTNEQKVRFPINALGEFSYCQQDQICIDNPETVDQRREKLGLLPLYLHLPESKWPQNYKEWYYSKVRK